MRSVLMPGMAVPSDATPTAAARTVVASSRVEGGHLAGSRLAGRSVESGPPFEPGSGMRSGSEPVPAGSKAARVAGSADMGHGPEPGEVVAPVTRPGPDEWWRSP
ncbi:hypothetical protein [Saccharothrix luteola]|uniref:hypothetical protein n=1 Tax=Saccharothrix luteola TaxID=2893018 RepID=UPI001E5D115A|nr:hypothetical protein [Saccharothrix luteola]